MEPRETLSEPCHTRMEISAATKTTSAIQETVVIRLSALPSWLNWSWVGEAPAESWPSIWLSSVISRPLQNTSAALTST